VVTFILSLLAIFISYLFGSIPMGYLVARLYGIDVTASGSGRIGGTNVLRTAGVAAAGLTVLGDILKGLIPIYFIAILGMPLTPALSASAAVLGHNYSIFLKFRGGVGAGTAMGSLAGLSFPIALIVAGFGLVALFISRYASVLSTTIAITGLLTLIIFAWLGYTPYEYIVAGVLNLIIMLYALRPNYARLRAGTERRIGHKSKNVATTSHE
jgi:glycerol-3-phosphate acyltransferase PlsY